MLKILKLLMATLFCVFLVADASTIIFEAGPFAIITDKDIEVMEVGSLDYWSTFGFEPISSRELIKDNYYNLKMGAAVAKDGAGILSKNPMFIEVSEKPIDDIFLFTPEAVKEVTVGRINQVNTTLYAGEPSNDLTPYFVNFSSNGIYCTVYDPNASETTITEFLEGFSVILKADIGNYNLSKIWSDSQTM